MQHSLRLIKETMVAVATSQAGPGGGDNPHRSSAAAVAFWLLHLETDILIQQEVRRSPAEIFSI
jgi:hypothetical protein